MDDTESQINPSSKSGEFDLLTEEQLAHRWQISTDKLRMDRWKKVGCPYLKLGRLVRYSLRDVLSFEDSIKVTPKGNNHG